ncbi:hypothetical protein EDD85DRAFT_829522 [Armillaria nabsnona]|nr:hypothetical protein EDD85DRAFT_829522 [Armillaria nabsnona]
MDTDEDCCVICLAGFTNPVCTPCPAQHMFCMQCLNGWISEAAEAGRTSYSCPSCRRAFDVAKGLADLRSHKRRLEKDSLNQENAWDGIVFIIKVIGMIMVGVAFLVLAPTMVDCYTRADGIEQSTCIDLLLFSHHREMY